MVRSDLDTAGCEERGELQHVAAHRGHELGCSDEEFGPDTARLVAWDPRLTRLERRSLVTVIPGRAQPELLARHGQVPRRGYHPFELDRPGTSAGTRSTGSGSCSSGDGAGAGAEVRAAGSRNGMASRFHFTNGSEPVRW